MLIIKFDRSNFMKNLNQAKKCWGCDFKHIGRDVSHNHCDYRFSTQQMDDQVNDRIYMVNGKQFYPNCQPKKRGGREVK